MRSCSPMPRIAGGGSMTAVGPFWLVQDIL